MTGNVSLFTEAHTAAPGAVVGYVSIDAAPEQGHGSVELTIRDRCGRIASVTVPAKQWARVLAESAGTLARSLRLG